MRHVYANRTTARVALADTDFALEWSGASWLVRQAIGPIGPHAVLIPPDTIPGDVSTTSTLVIDGAGAAGLVDVAFDQDWFQVSLNAGESYAFSLGANGSSLDTFLRLFDASGSLVAVDDDGDPAAGTDSLMRFTALQSGTYYLSAGGFESEIGAYTIGAAHGPPQNPLDTIALGFTFQHTAIDVYFALGGEQLGPAGAALRSFTAAEQQSVMQALQTLADVTNLSFASVNSSVGADFILTLSDLPLGVLGQAWPDAAIGYIEFDPAAPGWTVLGLAPGGLGFSTIIHEAGHALGLDHPHLDGQDKQVMQGVISEFDSYGSFLMNQQVFTIMSYNDGWPLGPNGVPLSDASGHAAAPMALDIALLQQRYGVDAERNQGDTTYLLGGANGSYVAIWDVGGVDRIASNTGNSVVIDLRAATLLSAIGGGGYPSYAQGYQGGYTIGAGVIIENATGGSGDDIFIGNAANNVMSGSGGSDTFFGDAGADTYDGGFSIFDVDIVSYELSLSAVSLNLSTGAATGDAQGDTFFSIEAIAGSNFNDSLTGSDARNVLLGLGGDDILVGLLGADVLDGGDGIDTVSYAADSFVAINLLTGVYEGAAVGDAYANVEIIVGTVSGDTLTGDAANNTFIGGGGADTLSGGAGNDTLEGGAGADRLDGGEGADTVSYASSNPIGSLGVFVRLIFPVTSIHGDAEGDTFTSIENIVGSRGGDDFFGTADANRIDGGAGDDDINGYFGDDTLIGGLGADTLDGGVGVDLLTGGAGNDIYVVDNAADGIVEIPGEGTDLVRSSVSWFLGAELENLTLIGAAAINGSGNDLANTLLGNGAANQLFGNGGNDSLDGGLGADAMFGGAGDDTYVVDNTGDVTFEGSALDGTDTVFSSVARTLGANFENLTLTGAAAITGAGNSLNNIITGNTAANTLFGNGGDDVLNGAGGADILHGNAGNDSLDGGLGADTAYGGGGDDSYFVDSGGDITFEGSALDGTDIVFSSVTRALGPNLENLTLTGGAAINGGGNGLDNVMIGNSAINALFGNAGADTLNGGQGGDKMYGGAGDDTYVVDNAGDVTFEGSALEGTDLVQSSVTRSLGANLENLTLTGTASINGVGNSLGNVITGNAGANQLFGNLGDDTLSGGAGNDLLAGGAGNDRFVFAPGSGSDTVTTFLAGGTEDSIDLSAYAGTGITWSITQAGANTVFDFSNGDQITLTNVIAANLVQTDPFGFG